ncbi:MAG: efflux RND transporter periplasmic adaptor subunit [Rhodospirillales bacterium]
MDRRAVWLFAGFALLAAAGGAYHFLAASGAGPSAGVARAAETAEPKATVVEATPAAVEAVTESIQAVGTLQPNEYVVVAPEIPGRIAAIRFKEGERAKAGEPLVLLDAAILRAELAKARSDLTLAEANRERAMTLARQGSGTLRARDEAVAAYQAAQAEVALAEARLEKATIAAPISGIVGLRAISPGAYVNPGDRLVELSDIDAIKVDFRVSELAFSELRTGQTVHVTVDALPGREFDGTIYAIDPIVDVNGRAVRLRARVPNPDRVLSPGLFARVGIVVDRRENAVLVPETAVFPIGDKRFVFRVVDGRAVRTEVALGLRRPGRVEVLRGLDGGAMVVTAGHEQVRDGMSVEVVKPPPGA